MSILSDRKQPDWEGVANLGDELVAEMKAAGTYTIAQRLLVAGAVALLRDERTPPNVLAQGLRDIGNFFGLYGPEAAGSQRRQFKEEQIAKGKMKEKKQEADLSAIPTNDLLQRLAKTPLPGSKPDGNEPAPAEGGGSPRGGAGAP